MSITLGNPQGALVFFAFFTTIGVALGIIIYVLFAYRGVRRPQFRNLGVMPRTGAATGLVVALLILYMAWSAMYRGFYGVEIDEGVVRLQYLMPSQVAEVPLADVTALEKRYSMGKGGNYRVAIVSDSGTHFSARMYSRDFDEAWEALAPFLPTR